MSTKGTLIAAMAAGFFATAAPLVARAADTDKVKCTGVNECKGKGACNGAGNDCAGQNACKGKGWINLSAKDCKEKGGAILKEKKKA
jgi:hypothetical protein